MSAKSETYESFIIDCLNKGMVEYKNVFEVFLSKFKCSEPTFAKYWKFANERYKKDREAIEIEKAKEYKEAELKAVKSNILDREKALEMQSNVVKLIYNKIVKSKEPNGTDTLAFNSTIDRLSKMQGWDAAKKVETTLKLGADAEFED